MKKRLYKRVITSAKRLLDRLDRLEPPIVGNEYVTANCSCVLGNAFLELRDDKRALSYHMRDYRTGAELYDFSAHVLQTRSFQPDVDVSF